MATAKLTLALISMTMMMMTMTPTLAFYYPQQETLAPHVVTASPEAVEEAVEQVLEEQQQSVDQYLGNLLNVLGASGASQAVQDVAEEQVEQVQETYEETVETVQEALETLIDAVYGPENSTDDVSDEVTTPATYVVNITAAPVLEEDDNTYQQQQQEEIEDIWDEVTALPTYAPTYAPADNNDDQQQIEEDDDDVTVMPTYATTADDSVESVDDDITTVAPVSTTVEESVEDSTDDDVITTVTPVTQPGDDSYVSAESSDDDINMCDDCDMTHGVGYNPYPGDCTLFVQCRLDSEGYPVVAAVKSCPHGLYWNQETLTCDHQDNVQCVDDICRGYQPTKPSRASCRGFWDCSSGTAQAKCCAEGFVFNPVTARCHYHPEANCTDDCLLDTSKFQGECQGMRGVAGDVTKFQMKLADGSWSVAMPCPASLGFSTNPCGCNLPLNHLPALPRCRPSLYLTFDDDAKDWAGHSIIKDHSGHNVWIQNDGVEVIDGKAIFYGNGRLIVPRFAGAWWGATVYVHLKYKSVYSSYNRQALFGNGDCQVAPSMSVCATPEGVEFFAQTKENAPANFTVPFGSSEGAGWQDVLFKLNDNQLHGYIDSAVSSSHGSAQTKGNLESRPRGLVIGGGKSCGTTCDDFEGLIDELTLYTCSPEY